MVAINLSEISERTLRNDLADAKLDLIAARKYQILGVTKLSNLPIDAYSSQLEKIINRIEGELQRREKKIEGET